MNRESAHAAATAAAIQDVLPASAVQVTNDRSAQGRAAAVLTAEGERRWRPTPASCVEDAPGVIAADAISVIAGERDGKLALCASPTCRAAFFDTSQSRTRRWCGMNTRGNRQKKVRFNANQCKKPGSAEWSLPRYSQVGPTPATRLSRWAHPNGTPAGRLRSPSADKSRVAGW